MDFAACCGSFPVEKRGNDSWTAAIEAASAAFCALKRATRNIPTSARKRQNTNARKRHAVMTTVALARSPLERLLRSLNLVSLF